MRLRWYCGLNENWGEPGATDCGGGGEIDLSAQQEVDWNDDLTPCVQCEVCGSILDHPRHYSETDPSSLQSVKQTDFEPPFSDEWFESGAHVMYEGGIWRVVREAEDEFDDREQKLAIEWVAGPRMGKLVYATGVRNSEVRSVTEMEVLAISSMKDQDS